MTLPTVLNKPTTAPASRQGQGQSMKIADDWKRWAFEWGALIELLSVIPPGAMIAPGAPLQRGDCAPEPEPTSALVKLMKATQVPGKPEVCEALFEKNGVHLNPGIWHCRKCRKLWTDGEPPLCDTPGKVLMAPFLTGAS
jgi:hypothetical protein